MIIEVIMNVIYNIFDLLTSPINLPSMPTDVTTYLTSALEYIGMGIGILSNYTHLTYLLALFGIIVSIDIGVELYKLVMFVIRKIPMLNIR